MSQSNLHPNEPPPSGAGKFVFIVLLMLVGGLGYLGYAALRGNAPSSTPAITPTPTSSHPQATATPPPTTPEQVQLNIAYGTEKQLWLQWAAEEFARTDAGRRIKVNLIGLGSVEGAHAVLNGPGERPIHVWSPASGAYRSVFENEWQIRHGRSSPIIRSENLALSPMVYVMWKERYTAFAAKYKEPTFRSVADAMHEPGGWSGIANRADWGLFKFGHTHPNQSNSGLLTLVLMAYDFHDKERGLTLADITHADFQQWLARFERAVARPGGELTHSTGTLMREMVLRGPSQYDCVMVYENLAIDYIKAAAGRWGDLQVVYPQRNMWNDNPYYILDVPWSDTKQRAAASTFLEFLMSEPIQRRALDHGFRPGNPLVPIKFAQSPFVQYESAGLRIDVARICDPPPADVLTNLLASFQRVGR